MSFIRIMQMLLVVMATVQGGAASGLNNGEEARKKGFVLSDFNKQFFW